MAGITQVATFDEILHQAKESFRQSFGKEPEVAACAPGRVNLIGEHVDYCDGFVLPMALPMVTLIVGSKTTGEEADIITHCARCDDPTRIKFRLKDLQSGKPKWANYIKGVAFYFGEKVPIPGFNAVIVSNVPLGAGLSSSAALEVATLTFLEQITGKSLESNSKRALMCQAAEHTFAKMPCGIMDQSISVFGKVDHALLLDCSGTSEKITGPCSLEKRKSLETFQIPFMVAEMDLVVMLCNSGVRHELSSSEYPLRRKQCAMALDLMKLKTYRDAQESHLEALPKGGPEEVLLMRARHVITEIKRTQDAAVAMKKKDFEAFGELMKKSHASLRDDFQVSCDELDTLVNAAINCPGVLGARMTGGGFGGCTVTLLQRKAVDSAIATMRKNFTSRFNQELTDRLEFYICTPSDGARHVSLKCTCD